MSNEYANSINERDEARREAAHWQAAAEANLAEIKIDQDVLNRKIIELRELRAQLAEANQRAERAEQLAANSMSGPLFQTHPNTLMFDGKNRSLEEMIRIANEQKEKLAALSAGVLPEGAICFVPDGEPRLPKPGEYYIPHPTSCGNVYYCMIGDCISRPRQVLRQWHPPKAESGEGDEYSQDPDAGTLASELCRIADSIGRNDCTRSWAEKFIYSIVDELPPAIANHVMRPPVESAPSPKAPAASEASDRFEIQLATKASQVGVTVNCDTWEVYDNLSPGDWIASFVREADAVQFVGMKSAATSPKAPTHR